MCLCVCVRQGVFGQIPAEPSEQSALTVQDFPCPVCVCVCVVEVCVFVHVRTSAFSLCIFS